MARKLCTVTGLDSRGLPQSVHVEAASLFEAAAAGLEALHQQRCLVSAVEVTVQEPGTQHRIHPQQLERWLQSRPGRLGRRACAQAARSRHSQ